MKAASGHGSERHAGRAPGASTERLPRAALMLTRSHMHAGAVGAKLLPRLGTLTTMR